MEWFYNQTENIQPLTEKDIDESPTKKFFSGRDFVVGDIILYGHLETKTKNIDFITFHIEEINTIYKITYADLDTIYPILDYR